MIMITRCEWCHRTFRTTDYGKSDAWFDFPTCTECRTGTVVETPTDRAREEDAR